MANVKALDPEDQTIHYSPRHLIEGDAAEFGPDAKITNRHQHTYHLVDALYHFFVPDPNGDPAESDPETGDDPDRETYHPEVIAKLMNLDYYMDAGQIVDSVSLRTEVGFTQFRDNADFIGGGITRGHIPQIRRWCYKHFKDAIYLDATGYSDEYAVDKERSSFEQLMELAGRTKEIIDDGICKHWPTDSKAVMRFINANQIDTIYSTNRIYDENEQIDTKWVIEGRFLAEELIKIPGFQQNFNKLVIFGAMRYILAGEINLNKLYRLMAKLGRTNTKLYFVG